MGRLVATLVALLALTWTVDARAFCGFYVGGAGAKLFNNATMVVLMRDGKRTVLSMQNNYQGPPKNFAMVVPVPVVLQKEQVKTLPNKLFDAVDKMASPRLVEYWERDPCWKPRPPRRYAPRMRAGAVPQPSPAPMPSPKDYKVKIEAQFEVGEYEVVILSAQDSTGLDAWLRDHEYTIPAGAEPVLKPYVQQGMKFFVAKVNSQKVKFVNGQAQLSPLRFHYDTDHFALPVRLGMLNSKGKQDLIVHILAPNQRYEVANFDNVTIPTNLEVLAGTKKHFASFYAALFDDTVKRNPNAVVTEYAWQATKCDPCPGPVLGLTAFTTLGGDVLPSLKQSPGAANRFVLTRLHARYDKNGLGEDLVFRKAKPIVGGREFRTTGTQLEKGAKESSFNNFQGRYIIRHPWTGPILCKNPIRGRWGGPPSGVKYQGPSAAQNTAFAKRSIPLNTFMRRKTGLRDVRVSKGAPMGFAASIGKGQASPAPVPSPGSVPTPPPVVPGGEETPTEPSPTGLTPTPAPTGQLPPRPLAPPPSGGCGGCHVDDAPDPPAWTWLAIGLALTRRRRRR